jgi:tRNA threonylcarbamoyladenosine biosynthesis protein TsaB
MSRVLSLETSTDICSVAIHNNGALIKEIVIREPQAHASKLSPLIANILKEASLSIADVNAVAVTSGPGSYTGLRIGTSTAKGICYALDIPLISIPTLDVIAAQVKDSRAGEYLICPMIDARRMEVYCQIFDKSLNTIDPIEAKVIDEKSFEELLGTQTMLFCGNGADKCRDTIKHPNAVFVDNIFPRAAVLGSLAFEKMKVNQFEDLEHFKPFYLKEFIAKKAQSLLD